MNKTEKPSNGTKYSEFIKFCIVGGIATLIDAIIFYTVKPFTNYSIALIIGYMASLSVNYLLTTLWTFKVKLSWKNLTGIVVAHLINLFIVRMSLMHLFTVWLHFGTNLSYIPTLGISIIINFLMVRLAAKL